MREDRFFGLCALSFEVLVVVLVVALVDVVGLVLV